MLFAPGSKIVFMGDSITDCGRAQPVGEGQFNPLGNGWVNVTAGLLGAVYPAQRLRIVNMGISGNTVRDLEARWERDVFALSPDWVVVMIGTNDVWRQFDLPLQTERHISEDEFRRILTGLVETTMSRVKGMVLMTPFYLEPLKRDAMRAAMDRYGKIVKETAQTYGTVFVDTQAAMAGVLKHCHSSALAWDRVHPSIIGHTAIARAFLNAVGFQWSGR